MQGTVEEEEHTNHRAEVDRLFRDKIFTISLPSHLKSNATDRLSSLLMGSSAGSQPLPPTSLPSMSPSPPLPLLSALLSIPFASRSSPEAKSGQKGIAKRRIKGLQLYQDVR